MPIIDGQYEAKISTTFHSTKEGVEAIAGSVYFSDRVFSVVWDKQKILQIEAMDYGKCVKCMKSMFDVGWRYADKQK
jgi:hypothetical protein